MVALANRQDVSKYEDQGQSGDDTNEGLVYFTDRDGLNYEIKVSQF